MKDEIKQKENGQDCVREKEWRFTLKEKRNILLKDEIRDKKMQDRGQVRH